MRVELSAILLWYEEEAVLDLANICLDRGDHFAVLSGDYPWTQTLWRSSRYGASVSGMAIAHGLNPDTVQRGRREARLGELTLPETPGFITVIASASAMVPHQSARDASAAIEIHLQRALRAH